VDCIRLAHRTGIGAERDIHEFNILKNPLKIVNKRYMVSFFAPPMVKFCSFWDKKSVNNHRTLKYINVEFRGYPLEMLHPQFQRIRVGNITLEHC